MNISGPIISLIAANTTANNLLGGRVYPDVLKQSTTYPAAAINIKGNDPNNTKTGPSDLDRVTVQIDVYGTTPTSASETEDAIRGALDYQSTGDIAGIFYLRTISGFSEKPELFRRISEFSIMLRR